MPPPSQFQRLHEPASLPRTVRQEESIATLSPSGAPRPPGGAGFLLLIAAPGDHQSKIENRKSTIAPALRLLPFALSLLSVLGVLAPPARAQTGATRTNPPIVLTVEGTNVFVQRFRSNTWEAAYPTQVLGDRDRGRTGLRSRTSVRLSDLSVLRLGELSEFEIQPLPDEKVEAEFSLFRGLMYLLNRDRPGKHRFITPTATAATRGTEFNLEVEPGTGRTVLTVLEGEAELTNAAGAIRIAAGEQGVAVLGQKPTKTAVIDTTRVVQWCLYYPAVLALDDLDLSADIRAALADSVAAYQAGDVLQAVSAYPSGRPPQSDDERLYAAAVLLGVGQVDAARQMLGGLGDGSERRIRRLADAMREMIATVSRQPESRPEAKSLPAGGLRPTELLAESYRLQAEQRLEPALAAARHATELSPGFGFAWVRVAELEFSRGRIDRASTNLDVGLRLAPRHAQGLALRGFLLAAQHDIRGAEAAFEQANALDGGLGNAWLGRGLCRIRQGRVREGRLDLQIAATAEPQRSLLRSYLGKAFSQAGDRRHAESELQLARELDAGDPTPWLYSALLLQQENRINEGVLDLQQSQDLNDNRQVYRSRLLLDQDRAVRGANLASLYRDAGLADWSVQEAGRAVNADYTSFSSHLFLANSFNLLRDPRQVNQRYETPWFTEFIVGNLLAPVGANSLSQAVSQNEYSRLLESDGLGFVSENEYFSHGAWRIGAVQHGTYQHSAYAAEMTYAKDNGWRPNNDIEQLAATLALKHEVSDRDSFLARIGYFDSEAGDVSMRYRASEANRGIRIRERQEPSLLLGYHHEWTPEHHTLMLAGRFPSRQDVRNTAQQTLFLYRPSGPISSVAPLFYAQDYTDDVAIYSAEIQQLARLQDHSVVLGARYQEGTFQTSDRQTNGQVLGVPFQHRITQAARPDLQRGTFYAYDQWQLWPTLMINGGLSFDRIVYPENYRNAPLSEGENRRDQWSPKAGFIFTPSRNTAVRGVYFQSLGGASYDHAIRLEPSQVAGFNQSYFSFIPESAADGSVAAPMEGWGLALEQKLRRGTFLTVSGDWLASAVRRQIGAVAFQPPVSGGSPFVDTQTRQILDYHERSLNVGLNQLVGDEWAFGVRYGLSEARLDRSHPDIPATALTYGGFQRQEHLAAVLHQLSFNALYNHASGFFAGASATWNRQSNHGYTPDIPGDDFWQFNVEGGWRFLRRRLEIRTGVLNLTDRNYRLNPLNLTSEPSRGREMFVGVRLSF